MTPSDLWQRYRQYLCSVPSIGLTLDISRMRFGDGYFAEMQPMIERSYAAMHELERGAISNVDEKRMVGHYWLRNPALAPQPGIRKEIEETVAAVKSFTHEVHSGALSAEAERPQAAKTTTRVRWRWASPA